ncbi:unnamed protein product [Dibothriocephalus latus]|uniref:Uncharacterized protein n=1 Tax=Dibothriocephalus latus TaxID=60516 RepID=A0A3P6U1R5_DIBLA|nr:unnamed protein product [Dibothriocephalus latus]
MGAPALHKGKVAENPLTARWPELVRQARLQHEAGEHAQQFSITKQREKPLQSKRDRLTHHCDDGNNYVFKISAFHLVGILKYHLDKEVMGLQ